MQLKMDRLQTKLDIMSKDYLYLKSAILDNIKIDCICHTQLIMTKPYIVYRGAASCDICQGHIEQTDLLLHCPKEKNLEHIAGYDVCLDCAIGNKQNYKKYKKLMTKKCKKLNRFEEVIKPDIMIMFEQKRKSIRKNAESITSVIPYIMDIQDMVFQEVMNRINGMDQEPGIDDIDKEDNKTDDDSDGSSDDNDDDESTDGSSDENQDERKPLLNGNDNDMTLESLYGIQNNLKDCYLKNENVTKSLNKLSECINYKVNDRECEWESWSANDIVEWIINIENGRFKPYEDTLRKELNDGDATGAILPHLDISDWRKSFSIKNWKDATDLNKYKNLLVTNKKEEIVAVPHEYPSPFDPEEEGAADTK